MDYKQLKNTGTYSKENFFISYAVRGSTCKDGTRFDIPTKHPIDAPVKEPSPLNTRYK